MKKIFPTFFLLFSLTASAGSVVISKIDLINETRLPEESIRQVLTVHEGDPFDPARWEQSLSYLKKWGRFREVSADKKLTARGVELRLTLKEGFLISGINLSGSYPFLSRRIRRLVILRAGDLFDEELAASQAKKIADFYEREGFAGTEVSFSKKVNDRKGTVSLEYRIHKGHRYRIGKITVTGNSVFPRGWFVSQINPLAAYEPSRLRESLEEIRKGYREAGYLRARVRIADLGRDETTRQVNPTLEVTEGDHVTVVFEGNQMIADRTFKKSLPIFTEGGYGAYEIEASEQEILRLYRARGFQAARVSSSRGSVTPHRILIRFQIDEGIETQVKRVQIDRTDGKKETSDRRIKKDLTTQEETIFRDAPWHPEAAEEDARNLPRLLKEQGALEAESHGTETTFSPLKDKVTVTFGITEGPITRLSEILFEGNQAFPEKTLRRKVRLRVGRPYSESQLTEDKEALVRYYADHGYPYVSVRQTLTGSTLRFSITEGQPVQIGEVLIVGNERTSTRAITSALLLKKGRPFSYQKMLESETILRRLGAFRNVDIETIGLSEKEPVVHLLVKVEESQAILLDFETSYNTDDQFTGIATLNDVNLFGSAKRANLKLTGGRDLQKGEVNLTDPFLFGYNLEGIVTGLLSREKRPSFDDVDVGGSVALLHELTPQVNLFGRYQITRTFFRNVTDTTGESEQDHTTSKFSLSTSYDTRNSYSDPSRGIVTFTGLDISNKIADAGFNFLHPKGYVAHYFTFANRWTLLNFARAEGIKVLGTDVLTRDQRLFLGGDYSIRGFGQDAVGPIGSDGKPSGGQLLFMYTVELQTRLFKNFKTALFVDSGSLTQNFSEVGLDSWRHTAGFGFRYITPVGPLRLDYGFKLDRQTGENLSRLHFAFGYAF